MWAAVSVSICFLQFLQSEWHDLLNTQKAALLQIIILPEVFVSRLYTVDGTGGIRSYDTWQLVAPQLPACSVSFECLQEWRPHNTPRKPVPVFEQPYRKLESSYILMEFVLFQFVSIVSCFVTGHRSKVPLLCTLPSSIYHVETFLLQAEQSHLSQLLLTCQMLQPPINLEAFCWPNSSMSICLLYWEAQNWTHHSRCWLEGKHYFLWCAGNAFPDVGQGAFGFLCWKSILLVRIPKSFSAKNFAFAFVELHEIAVCPFLQLTEVPLNGSTTIMSDN